MTTQIDYALLAGSSYISNRDAKNRFPIPQGWVKVTNPPYFRDDASGIEAISFTNGTEIVISFAGTNGDDIGTNVLLGLGAVAYQLKQAAAYYLEVKAANPTATITFTGHSLGGGLASLLGVLFAEKAVTFDQAPFASAANVVNAQLIKDYLATLPKTTDNRGQTTVSTSRFLQPIPQATTPPSSRPATPALVQIPLRCW